MKSEASFSQLEVISDFLKRDCNLVWKFLSKMFSPCFPGYINEFEIVDDHRAGKIVVFLNGRLNKCGVISPRFDVTLNKIEQWASNLLPSRQFG